MRFIWPFFSGLIFSVGLVISGMVNPEKVTDFLDLAGTWDPSLAFVMGGALVTTAIGFRFVLRRPAPLHADRHHLPTSTVITPQLLTGSALFGIGWGISGLCPGPAIAAFPMTLPVIAPFAIGLLAGLVLFQGYERRFARSS
ncbi:DUF6691 family protein [Aquisalinus flavus]|uniref:Membrane protein n=1 Tax=Aquisalinus flavus TaxID=1526572 RepID=A0A8J2V543_9PROT|nr:DUF6691 family protein [Aquisalinus flavus]MBD0426476.1 YeeE/YedE family protein [Aquisalinus flavus]UNE47970.1 YeeE/YedE family protein [Aquisalinus flavus]GGD07623.1 membrane protein [Aquisalinus flavus]